MCKRESHLAKIPLEPSHSMTNVTIHKENHFPYQKKMIPHRFLKSPLVRLSWWTRPSTSQGSWVWARMAILLVEAHWLRYARFLAPTEAQGVTMSVRLDNKLSRALNSSYLSLLTLSKKVSLRSLSGLSQVSLRSLSGVS